MMRMSRGSLAFLAALLAVFAACSDDPVSTEQPGWTAEALPSLGTSILFDLAFSGGRGLAVGLRPGQGTSSPVILEKQGSSWTEVTPPDMPSSGLLLGAAFRRDGSAVLVGAVGTVARAPLIMEDAGGWARTALPVNAGALGTVVAAHSDSIWTLGTGDGGLSFLSRSATQWLVADHGFTTPQEKGIRDLCFADDVVYACGWDDGGPPYSVLRFNSGSGWLATTGPEPDNVDIEYFSICVDSQGTMWVGGHLNKTVQQGGAQLLIDSARLYRRPIGGIWTSVAMPDADDLGTVQDIYEATSGEIFVVCERQARLFRFIDTLEEIELPSLPGGFYAISESADDIYLAGFQATLDSPIGEAFVLRGRP